MSYLIGISTSYKGRIYQAPTITEANGSKVANCILAVENGQDHEGNKITDFIDCAFWGRDAELIMRYPEGHEINIICGKLSASAYQDKADKLRVRYKVTVYVWQSCQPLSKEKSEPKQNQQQAPSSEQKETSKSFNKEELIKQAVQFTFTKGEYAGKTVLEVLEINCRYVYDLCNNERVSKELQNLLKVAYNYWYYNKYQKGKAAVSQKADSKIEGVKRNLVKSVPAGTPSSKLPY